MDNGRSRNQSGLNGGVSCISLNLIGANSHSILQNMVSIFQFLPPDCRWLIRGKIGAEFQIDKLPAELTNKLKTKNEK